MFQTKNIHYYTAFLLITQSTLWYYFLLFSHNQRANKENPRHGGNRACNRHIRIGGRCISKKRSINYLLTINQTLRGPSINTFLNQSHLPPIRWMISIMQKISQPDQHIFLPLNIQQFSRTIGTF